MNKHTPPQLIFSGRAYTLVSIHYSARFQHRHHFFFFICRSDEVERNAQLRTRAMREREATTRVYRFTLLRVKFPDGFILQGMLLVKLIIVESTAVVSALFLFN